MIYWQTESTTCKWNLFLDSFCYAEVLRFYYLVQTKVVDKMIISQKNYFIKLIEEGYILTVNYPNVIPFMSSKEKLKHWKVPSLLKFHIPDKYTHPKEYCHSMLFLFFPFHFKMKVIKLWLMLRMKAEP